MPLNEYRRRGRSALCNLQERDLPSFVYPLAGTILGLIVGSFLATVAVRWPKGQSVLTGRSHCDHCGRQLGAAELVPVISYVALRAKCRVCGKQIRPDYPLIELVSGLMGGLSLYVSPDVAGLSGAIFGWLLLTAAALDAEHHWLPDRLTISTAALGLAFSFVVAQPPFLDRMIGGLAGFLSLFLVATAYRRVRGRDGLGGGDPKLLGAIGCWLGWGALPLVLLGASLVGLVAVGLMRLRGQAVASSIALPLGSFMAIVAFPLWLYQSAIGGTPLLP